MNNCAVDSALGAWEREQANIDNKYDADAKIMQPFVAAIADMRKIIDGLPLSDDDKEVMKCYICTALHETNFATEQHKNEVNFDEHITGFYTSI